MTLMRKLEKQMNFALSNKGNWAGSNTTVTYNENTNCSLFIYTVIKLQPLIMTL